MIQLEETGVMLIQHTVIHLDPFISPDVVSPKLKPYSVLTKFLLSYLATVFHNVQKPSRCDYIFCFIYLFILFLLPTVSRDLQANAMWKNLFEGPHISTLAGLLH